MQKIQTYKKLPQKIFQKAPSGEVDVKIECNGEPQKDVASGLDKKQGHKNRSRRN